MRRATASAPGLAAIALAGACSLTTSFDGLTGGAAGDGGADGGSDVRDADAETAESGGGGDAAETGADGGFCATRVPAPSFCDDFERATDVVGPWDRRIGPAAQVNLDTSPEGNRELQIAIPQVTAGGYIQVGLNRGLSDVASDFRLFHRLRLDAPPGRAGMQVDALEVTNSAGFFHVGIIVQSDGVYLFEQSFPSGTADVYRQHALTPTITYGVAHALDLHVTVTPPHITLLVDGATAYDGDAISFFAPGVASVTAGISYADIPAGALTMHVDDVALTASP